MLRTAILRSALVSAVLASGAARGSDVPRIMAYVETLTSPAFAGRGAGGPDEQARADSLASWLAAAGFAPAFAGTWWQPFPLEGEGWAGQPLAGRTGRNVAGSLPGAGALADRWIVLGAHHDHLGRVAAAADDAPPPGPSDYYPGANDNASGVAAVLGAAADLAAHLPADGARRGLLVVFFDGEEAGLQGSARFVAEPPVPLDAIDAMINLDTVGRLQDGTLHVSGVGTAEILPALVAAADAGDFTIRTARGGWSGSDHMIFNTKEIPVVFLFGGAYPDYNRPSDTAANLDPEALAAVAAYAGRLTAALLATPDTLAWRMVADHLRAGDEADDAAQNRSTWLGTLPDFSEGVVGYKLAGVFDDSPAQEAGLQKGDVLVRFAGQDVSDLATFTRALRSVDPGDPVEVEVVRDGRSLRFTVVMGDRSQRR